MASSVMIKSQVRRPQASTWPRECVGQVTPDSARPLPLVAQLQGAAPRSSGKMTCLWSIVCLGLPAAFQSSSPWLPFPLFGGETEISPHSDSCLTWGDPGCITQHCSSFFSPHDMDQGSHWETALFLFFSLILTSQRALLCADDQILYLLLPDGDF